MQWYLEIHAKQNIKEKDIDTIVSKLPEEFHRKSGNLKQDWGWSTAVNILKPINNELELNGSISLKYCAEPLRDFIKKELRKLGYTHVRHTRLSS